MLMKWNERKEMIAQIQNKWNERSPWIILLLLLLLFRKGIEYDETTRYVAMSNGHGFLWGRYLIVVEANVLSLISVYSIRTAPNPSWDFHPPLDGQYFNHHYHEF